MKRLFAVLMAAGVSGAVFGQTFTDLAGNATYEGKTGLKKLATAIDANFALIEAGSIHQSSLTVSNGSNTGTAPLYLQADKFDDAGDMTAVVGTDGAGIAFQSDVSAKGTLATKASIGTDGIINTLVGLDAIGAVDLDYGSADVTDHTFVTDGTGDGEIVLPLLSIGNGEINDLAASKLSGNAALARLTNALSVAGSLPDGVVTTNELPMAYYDGTLTVTNAGAAASTLTIRNGLIISVTP